MWIDEIHGVLHRNLPRARYDFLLDYWAPGKLYKEQEEDTTEYHFEYHYVNRGRKRNYHEYLDPQSTRKRETRLNEIAYKEALSFSDIVKSDRKKEHEGILPKNTITILIQNTNKRKTRNSTNFKRNSDLVRETWYQDILVRDPENILLEEDI